jgi:hypothetical protein
MGVIFADDISNDTSRFFIGTVPIVGQLVHGKQHAAVNRLEAITHIG